MLQAGAERAREQSATVLDSGSVRDRPGVDSPEHPKIGRRGTESGSDLIAGGGAVSRGRGRPPPPSCPAPRSGAASAARSSFCICERRSASTRVEYAWVSLVIRSSSQSEVRRNQPGGCLGGVGTAVRRLDGDPGTPGEHVVEVQCALRGWRRTRSRRGCTPRPPPSAPAARRRRQQARAAPRSASRTCRAAAASARPAPRRARPAGRPG